MRLTRLSHVIFVCFPLGLSADRRGLAKDPDGQIACHQPPRGHEDLVEVCQPLWQEWTPGQYLDIFAQSPSVFADLTPDHA